MAFPTQARTRHHTRRRTTGSAPPPRVPTPVHEHMHFIGERVVLATSAGKYRQDYRAVSNVFEDERGQLMVNVVPEAEWYLLAHTGRYSDGSTTSKLETHPAQNVYVEILHEEISVVSTLT